MKKILPFLFVALQSILWIPSASAADCVQGSLTSYTALGSTGCTIGGFTFSDFALLQRPTGASGFPSIVVVPIVMGTTIVGIDLVVGSPASSVVASRENPAVIINNGRLDDVVAYRVTGTGPRLNGASLYLNGVETTGLASVTGVENLCLDGLFTGVDGVSNCSTGPSASVTLVVADETPDMAMFLPRTSLAVVTDIGLDSGPTGDDSGALTSASNRFTFAAAPGAIPEPAPVLLLTVGVFALLAVRRRRDRRPPAR